MEKWFIQFIIGSVAQTTKTVQVVACLLYVRVACISQAEPKITVGLVSSGHKETGPTKKLAGNMVGRIISTANGRTPFRLAHTGCPLIGDIQKIARVHASVRKRVNRK